MNGKSCRFPIGFCSVAACTIGCDTSLSMAWIGALIIIIYMAILTNGRCSGIPIGMTFKAIGGDVCSCQWKIRIIVIKTIIVSITCRVTFKTSRVAINITTNFIMLIVQLRLIVMAYYTTVR